jgi:RimJ/RimL family protein N-acetyltransferase
MNNIKLREAINDDKVFAVDLDYRLDKDEHIKHNREEKIAKAIMDGECFIILVDNQEAGFVIFDYRFFDQGWIELIIIDEAYRGKTIAVKTFNLLIEQCRTNKIFTSTNRSNTPMQRALAKADFTFAGEINGLDDGDPERFYYWKR